MALGGRTADNLADGHWVVGIALRMLADHTHAKHKQMPKVAKGAIADMSYGVFFEHR